MSRFCTPAATALAACVLALAASAAHAEGETPCASFVARVNAAATSDASDEAAKAFDEAEASKACPAAGLEKLGRGVALVHYSHAARADQSDASRVVILERGLKYGHPWQTAAYLGDMLRQRGQGLAATDEAASAEAYQRAARLYGQALADMVDDTTEQRASMEIVEAVSRKFREMQFLSPGGDIPADRCGNGVVTFRGCNGAGVPALRAVAFEFERGSDKLDAKGRALVAATLKVLAAEGVRKIRLTGHTDSEGSDPANDRLSRRRANAVKALLVAGGFKGEIVVEGRGKRQPPLVEDRSRYAEKDLRRLYRRVELER